MPALADPSRRFVLPADSPLLTNMAAIWATDPALATELETVLDTELYPLEPTRCEVPTVAIATSDGRRVHLHSRYQPLEEAKRLIAAADIDEKTLFCVHGLGLGYHVEELFARASEEAILVVAEPDLRLIATAWALRDFSPWILSGRLMLLTRPDRAQLVAKLTPHQAMFSVGFAFVPHGPSIQAHGEFHRQIQSWMGEFAALCRTAINTTILNGRRTCENIARNLRWYVTAPGIVRLRNCHTGQPAIIVSAGPSLRKNKHLLKQAQGRAVLVAVQTTLQPLLEMGIQPDYVTSIDYHDICTRFFEKLPADLKTELVAEVKASSKVLGLYPGPVSVIGNDFAAQLLREMDLHKGGLRAAATVAHLAFYLAEYIGCDPIIFVGQDLGFSDGLCYTPGTGYEDVWRPELGRFCTMEMKQWEHIVRERPILRRIEDCHGGTMYTEERLFAYLRQFERDFACSSAKIIDATEGGAKKAGAERMTLADALDRHCQSPLPARPADHPGYRHDLMAPALECLRRRRDEAEEIRQLGQRTLPLLEEVAESIDDQGKVNRLIAQIDTLRARMHELNDCYEAVCQLTQFTELLRFRSDRQLAASRVTGLERQRRQVQRDITNVQAIIEAAGQFRELLDEVIRDLEK